MDHASTTPVDKRVLKAMLPYLTGEFGNPATLYEEGVRAKRAVADARQKVARLANARPEEVIFTGSGTESDNLGILGVVRAARRVVSAPHVVMTNIEHPAVLECARFVKEIGGEVTIVPVEENGIVDPRKVLAAVKPSTVLVTVMLANNEIGTIQPVGEIARLLKAKRAELGSDYPYLHTDASQAANYLDISFQKHGVDLMTLDGSKIYGPKGVGALIARSSVELAPLGAGGGQERGVRPGTENVASIVGFAAALELAQAARETESVRLAALRDRLVAAVTKIRPDVLINGDPERRLPNNANICVPGLDAEFAVIRLDRAGIAASAASACSNLSDASRSYVIEALGEKGKACASSSLRFTLGRSTTRKDIDLTAAKIKVIIIGQ